MGEWRRVPRCGNITPYLYHLPCISRLASWPVGFAAGAAGSESRRPQESNHHPLEGVLREKKSAAADFLFHTPQITRKELKEMRVKYYGVPHNPATMRGFLLSNGIKATIERSARLLELYRWILEEPRQWETVGFASFRTDPPPFYSKRNPSTFHSDVRILARVGLIFPMYADATLKEQIERIRPTKRIIEENMKDPDFVKSILSILPQK